MSVRGQTAVIGVGSTPQGQFPGRSANDLAIQAIENALADAQIAKSEVDGLITCRNLHSREGIDEQVGLLMGIDPAFSATLDYGSSNFSLHLGVMAIAAGLASTIVLAYGTNQRSSRVSFGHAVGGAAALSTAAGLVHVAGPAALAFNRHQHLYGTTEEQLGWVAVGQREWARSNPLAIFREPLTMEQYLASSYVVAPLRRADLTMISDGGAAIVLTTAERARHFAKKPVHVLAISEQTALSSVRSAENLMRPWLAASADRIWKSSGMQPKDIDVLYVQDATSVWVLQMLEAYGFCGVGEGGPFLASGATRPGGSLPLNTNGGQLSESYMWGWLHLCEAVRQLRGECGDRQVPGAQIALDCSTHDFFKCAATILGTEV